MRHHEMCGDPMGCHPDCPVMTHAQCDCVDALGANGPYTTRDITQAGDARHAPTPVSALKPTNPKDSIGSGKLPLELVPDVLIAEASTAFLEGALKYGRFNWRIAGVRASIYRAAEKRHMDKWWNGEDRDRKTRVRHLANAAACIGILLDAELCGMLQDDRPPRAPLSERIDEHDATVAHLKDLFKDHNPRQFTIADTPGDSK